MDTQQFEGRKREHIRHALDPANQATGQSGLDRIHLTHDALPDLNFEAVRLDSLCLGQSSRSPFYIAGMTAGHPDAVHINRTLALAAAERGWAMGVGSQRRELESADGSSLDHWRRLRDEVPALTLIANLGISQIIDVPLAKIAKVIEALNASALAIHLNPLQEALQPEGTPRFKGALNALQRLTAEVDVPIVLKETGCGFSKQTVEKLRGIQLAAIDVSGLGGTHWGRIEGARAEKRSTLSAAAETFANWGESTAESVLNVREVLPKMEVWASGGVRSGLDAAKLIALGADRVGYAQPALEAALKGGEELLRWMEIQEYELKVALFCTGCASPVELQKKEKVWRPSAI